MKLSTFVKKVIAIHTGRANTGIYNKSKFVCNNALVVMYLLSDDTKNKKLIRQYRRHSNNCIAFVNKAIHGYETVQMYLDSINDFKTDENEFRLAMLNDMLDWAVASESSESSESKSQ